MSAEATRNQRHFVNGRASEQNRTTGSLPRATDDHNHEELDYASTVMFGSHQQRQLQALQRDSPLNRSRRFQSLRVGDKKLRSVATEDKLENLAESKRVSAAAVDPLTKPTKPNVFRRCVSCAAFPRLRRTLTYFGSKVGQGFGEEWLFLVLLGVIMACLSFIMDYAILKFQEAHIIVYYEVKGSVGAQYAVWVAYPLIFVTFATGFVHLVEPNAVGSGIPEMKTIIRGVRLHEYLSFRTLISKTIGLTIALGSGMPIGKEGPFVHVASMVATQLSTLVTSFQGFYQNPARNTEMLAAACAVGVACNFAAPIGGVLFSIEVTATYFAVRNYWRGFFSAVIGALVFQLIGMAADNEETILALFSTEFPVDIPFDPLELFIFAFIGVVCGFAGAFYVFFHRHVVLFIRKPFIHKLLSKNRFIYPSLVVIVIASITFPPALGQYMAADLTSKEQINSLFSNFPWTQGSGTTVLTLEQEETLSHWNTQPGGVFVCLSVFIVSKFVLSALAVTMPIPNGIFVPSFLVGAGFGRLVGEFFHYWFPDGIGGVDIKPGCYALVGSAAMSGSVTRTISTSVIVFELTGQISHSLPILIAVILANMVAQCLQPSMYDSIIQMKQLPFLPDIVSASKDFYDITAEHIMQTKLSYICWKQPYKEVYAVIRSLNKNEVVPLVESHESMVLLGTVRVGTLHNKISKHISKAALMHFVAKGSNFGALNSRGMRHYRKHHPNYKKASNTLSDDASIHSNWYKERRSSKPQFSTDFQSFMDANPEAKKTAKVRPLANLFSGSIGEFSTTAMQDNCTLLSAYQSKRSSITGLSTAAYEGNNMTTAAGDSSNTVSLSHDDILEWEELRMKLPIKFDYNEIDESPFCIVTLTSLPKIHSLFSLLGLNKVYVTRMGKLVGFITLNDVRLAVQHSSAYLGTQMVNKDAKRPSGYHSDVYVSSSDDSDGSSADEGGGGVRTGSPSSDDGIGGGDREVSLRPVVSNATPATETTTLPTTLSAGNNDGKESTNLPVAKFSNVSSSSASSQGTSKGIPSNLSSSAASPSPIDAQQTTRPSDNSRPGNQLGRFTSHRVQVPPKN